MGNTRAPWILLRGLAREKGHWGEFIDVFAQAVTPHPVLAIDLPGVGEFRDVAVPASISELIHYVREQAKQQTGAQKFRLMAISLGGMLVLEWLREFAAEVECAVIINSSVSSLSPLYRRLRWQSWVQFVQLLALQNPREREQAILNLVANNTQKRTEAVAEWTRIAQHRAPAVTTVLKQLYAAKKYAPALNEVAASQVLLLSSLGDRLVDPSCSEAMHHKTQWSIRRHPWAGHDLPLDDGPWICDQVQAWLTEKNL